MMTALHVIEGFFGRPWSWSARASYAGFLKSTGYASYIYAPKDDAFLRRQWREPWPDATSQELALLAATYHDQGLKFGVGLSPFEIYRNFDHAAREQLDAKLADLNALGIDILCLLFDDMRGDLPDLAQTPVLIAHYVAERCAAEQVIMCPTYYSLDPVLEQVFGARPADYWDTLGHDLDSTIDLFWTGEKVCSERYTSEHLEGVADTFRRKPFLWDNYPVNDGAKTSRFLNLRPFSGRARVRGRTTGHAVNPMNQPLLSKLPLHTLRASHDPGPQQSPDALFRSACTALGGDTLYDTLAQDLGSFQDAGLDSMTPTHNAELLTRYEALADDEAVGPFAREIVAWLKGEYAFDPACLTG